MNLRRVSTVILINSLLLILGGSKAYAQNESFLVDSAFFMEESAPHQALALYNRITYFKEENDSMMIWCKERCAKLALRIGEYKQAADYYFQLSSFTTNDSINEVLILKRAFCYLLDHEYYKVIRTLDSSSFNPEPGSLNYYTATLYLAFAHELSNNYQFSVYYFSKMYPALNPNDSVTLQKLNNKMIRSSLKNAGIAYIMSLLVPGSGQLYSGYPLESLHSFLLNGVLISTSIFIAVTYTPIDGILTAGMLVPRYYSGGADKARLLARQKNAIKAKTLFEKHRAFFESTRLNIK